MIEKEPSIEDLILSGVLEVAGIDDKTGEFLYTFTPKTKQIMPELYNMHLNNVHSEIMYFWEKGFLELDDLMSNNPRVKLTEKAFNAGEIEKLPRDKMLSLYEIKRILKVV